MSSTEMAERPSPRAAPAGLHRRVSRPPWMRATGYWAFQYRRTWRSSLSSSFLFPVLYLAAMGAGLGTLVDHHVHTVDGVSYLRYVGPGVLAASAMQVGVNASMYPVMGAIKWDKTYHAMLAAPLRVVDVLAGHVAWFVVRLVIGSGIFLGVLAAWGVVHSPWALLALPAAVLTGLAFAIPGAAFAATQENDAGFTTVYRIVVVPLFLFSGTFFPITSLPGWLQPVAMATPLFHGVALCRGLVLGSPGGWAAIGHLAYLIGLTGVAAGLATLAYRRRLVV